MKTQIIYCLFALILCCLSSCDSGDIYPKDSSGNVLNIKVTAVFSLSNIETFPANYKIAIASFSGSSLYPGSFTVIDKPTEEGGLVTVSLSSIPEGTTSISLCLLQAVGNKKVYSFYNYPLTETPKANLNIPQQHIDLAPLGRLSAQLFSQCIQCHGGGSSASAGLYLTPDSVYKYLVNHVAKNSVKNRVTPYSTSNSFLMTVLQTKNVVKYNHTDISTLNAEDITLAEAWIMSGAQNNN